MHITAHDFVVARVFWMVAKAYAVYKLFCVVASVLVGGCYCILDGC